MTAEHGARATGRDRRLRARDPCAAALFSPIDLYFWPLCLALITGLAPAFVRPPAGHGWPRLLAVPPAVVLLPTNFAATLSLQPGAFVAVMLAGLLSTVVDARIAIGGAALALAQAAYLLGALLFFGAPHWLWYLLTIILAIAAVLLVSVPLSRAGRRRSPQPAP
jgi:hypothetical protein